jgi:hypothetical protein
VLGELGEDQLLELGFLGVSQERHAVDSGGCDGAILAVNEGRPSDVKYFTRRTPRRIGNRGMGVLATWALDFMRKTICARSLLRLEEAQELPLRE